MRKLLAYLNIGGLLGLMRPQPAPSDDLLYNRRVLAYYSIAFTVYWSHLILAVYVFALYKAQASDAAIIAAFLAVPGTIAGMNVWKYLIASEKDDELKNGKPVGGPSVTISDSTVTVAAGPRDERPVDGGGQPVQVGAGPGGGNEVEGESSGGLRGGSGEGQDQGDLFAVKNNQAGERQ